MATKKTDTASFVLRFTPKVFENEEGKPDIQWRGTIQHVQDGDEKRFADFEKAVDFIREKLSALTIEVVDNKSQEEENLLSKSMNLWKQLARDAPKNMVDAFLDPKKQVENIQNQISQVGEMINVKQAGKLADEIKFASKADLKEMLELYEQMAADLSSINKKMAKINKKLKK